MKPPQSEFTFTGDCFNLASTPAPPAVPVELAAQLDADRMHARILAAAATPSFANPAEAAAARYYAAHAGWREVATAAARVEAAKLVPDHPEDLPSCDYCGAPILRPGKCGDCRRYAD